MKLRLAYWTRYVQMVPRYGTARKLANLSLAYCHYLVGTRVIPTMPAFLKVEISRKCEVHCRYCTYKKEDLFFSFDQYKELVDCFQKYLFLVSLYDIGEPLHNQRVLEYIRYAHERRLATAISSSLSLRKPDDFWRELVCSGLDQLVCSIDGVTQNVYQQYRTCGDLNLVLDNLGKLLACRTACKSCLAVEWQMLDLSWNRHEQRAAKSLAKKLGCDRFRLIPEAVLPRRRNQAGPPTRKRNCLLPYVLFLVDSYHRVRSCYKNYDVPMFVGNIDESSLEQIWNGPEMISIRDKHRIRRRLGCRTCRE